MRSVFRAMDPSDLEAARMVVSRAEQEALSRAEDLCREAAQLFQSAAVDRPDLERQVREEVLAAVKDDLLRAQAQSDQIIRRAEQTRAAEAAAIQSIRAEAEEEIGRAWVDLDSAREEARHELKIAWTELHGSRAELEMSRDHLRMQVDRMRETIAQAWSTLDGFLAEAEAEAGPGVAAQKPMEEVFPEIFEVDLRVPVPA